MCCAASGDVSTVNIKPSPTESSVCIQLSADHWRLKQQEIEGVSIVYDEWVTFRKDLRSNRLLYLNFVFDLHISEWSRFLLRRLELMDFRLIFICDSIKLQIRGLICEDVLISFTISNDVSHYWEKLIINSGVCMFIKQNLISLYCVILIYIHKDSGSKG